jgi:hypothetical protein
VQLCLKVQPIATKSGVQPGGTASYAVWVWSAGGAATTVQVTISAKAAGKTVTPKFTVCPSVSGLTCNAGGIAQGAFDELQASVGVPTSSAAGSQVILFATAKAAANATSPPPASGTVTVAAKPSTSPSRTPSGSGSSGTTPPALGIGGTLPGGILPTLSGGVNPATSLLLPGPQSPSNSLGNLFPTVSPDPTPSPYSAILPSAHNVRVADAAATFPFSSRLIGSELVGLAVLAAALALAIVRFSLRRPRPQHGKD